MRIIQTIIITSLFFVSFSKTMERENNSTLNEPIIQNAYQTARSRIPWILERNKKLNAFKGAASASQENANDLEVYCDHIKQIASTSKTTTEFQAHSKEDTQPFTYCIFTLYKDFLETLKNSNTPTSSPYQ